jgi:hypothetical protein
VSLLERICEASDRLFVNEVEGVMWASNRYWAVDVPTRDHDIAQLLALYNLALEPSVLRVGETLVRDTADPTLPDIAGLITKHAVDLAPIQPVRVHDVPAYVGDTSGPGTNWLALYELPNGRVVLLDHRFVRLVEQLAPGEWYGGTDPIGQPVFRLHDGKPTAMLMGVGNYTVERAQAGVVAAGAT